MRWLSEQVGTDFQVAGDQAEDALLDQVLAELHVVSDRVAFLQGNGCMEAREEGEDPEETAQALAGSLVHGWPTVEKEPEGLRSPGRFAKCFPLEFPMGVSDPFDQRPRDVPFAECVQHLLRLRSGVAVHGRHGHRLVWALVNALLILESAGKGFAVHRVSMRRIRGRVHGLEVLTRA